MKHTIEQIDFICGKNYSQGDSVSKVISRNFTKTKVKHTHIPMLFYLVYNWKTVKGQIEERIRNRQEIRAFFDTFIA